MDSEAMLEVLDMTRLLTARANMAGDEGDGGLRGALDIRKLNQKSKEPYLHD